MNKHNTILGQMLDFIPRSQFQKLVKNHQTERGAKGFSSWAHLVSMLFGQLSRQSGLRSIQHGINKQRSSFYHLGLTSEIKRSTLSYANTHRDSKLYEDLFYHLVEKLPNKQDKHGFRFKNPLYSIDATTIDLCLSLFDWAEFREKKGGIKLNVKLDHQGKIPCFVHITSAKTHESRSVRNIPLEKGDIVTFDRGYTDYNYFSFLCNEKIWFVTRLKTNASYTVVKENICSNPNHILADEIIELDGFYAAKNCPFHLRRIVSYDSQTNKTIEILTNHLSWSATTIASIYKDRWHIELFFKAIKQNLKIKRFYGTSRNSVYTQIWIALIAYLLFYLLKSGIKTPMSFSCFVSVFPIVAFQRRCLYNWFVKAPPDIQESIAVSGQLELL